MKNILSLTAAALLMTTGAASAATLSYSGTGQSSVIWNSNDITAHDFNYSIIDTITGDQKSASTGLSLTGGPALVTYTYLGSEAGNRNYAADVFGTVFENRGTSQSAVGDSVSGFNAGGNGLLDFAFGTSFPVQSQSLFSNNGVAAPATSTYAVAYVRISDTSYYVLFDDIHSQDRDFDDMAMRIDISEVPLPAGGLLLLSGLLGAGALRRRNKKAA